MGAGRWISERLVGLRLGFRAGYRSLRARQAMVTRLRLKLLTLPAPAVLLVPQDLRTADPVRADEIMAGINIFAGRIVTAADPFAVQPPTSEWAEQLAGFTWLRHLRAAGTPEAAETARRLTLHWMDRAADHKDAPQVRADRIRAFLGASGLILAGADAAFYRRFSRMIWRQVRLLEADYPGVPPGADRLAVLNALVTAGLCVDGEDKLLAWAAARLGRELGRQILADGGHISRDPTILVSLVLDLLPLRQLFPARNATPPTAILTAVDRMMPMIRFFRLGDGTLARFNGAGPTAIDQVTTALIYDAGRGTAGRSARHSGYERIEAGAGIVIMDTGAPPPPRLSGKVHAGCLAFEFSSGRALLVINCGVPALQTQVWRREARKTAAHSTLTVAERSSARFVRRGPAGGAMVQGPREVACRRDDLTVRASHDGYAPRLGIVHHRVLRLDDSGTILDGEDRVEGPDAPYAVRFHLHPAVQVIPTENPRAVLLRLMSGEGWQFSADQPVRVDDSVALAMPEGPRRTRQIVIDIASSAAIRDVVWRFRQLVSPQDVTDEEVPQLPL